MDVHVLDVVKAAPPIVTFACAAGVAAGVWRDADLPVPGQDISVELDIPDALHWGESAASATEAADLVGVRGDAVVMRGLIEPLAEEDEVVTVRVSGGLLLVKIVGVPPGVAGCWVELRSVRLELYPTRI
ncbi:hypothetical protein AB0I85_26780 [Micromonospora echinofusca]|uniref:hypothetical protein n=1 Tax=Micromonospora echinofusca TaxID=47858 RepID=UPI003320EE97